jgi:hypothetical protein
MIMLRGISGAYPSTYPKQIRWTRYARCAARYWMSSLVTTMAPPSNGTLSEIKLILDNILYAVRDKQEEVCQLRQQVQDLAEAVARCEECDDATTARLDRTREDLIALREELDRREKELRDILAAAVQELDKKLGTKADHSGLAAANQRLESKADTTSLKLWVTVASIISGIVCFALGYILP